jgi:hypothetical protein
VVKGRTHQNYFKKFDLECVWLDVVTFMGLVKTCASVVALEKGKQVHEQVI